MGEVVSALPIAVDAHKEASMARKMGTLKYILWKELNL